MNHRNNGKRELVGWKKNRTKTFLSLHADLTYSYHPSFKCKLKTLVGKSSLDLSDHPEASRLCVTEDGCVGASDSSSAHSPPTCRPDCDLISLNKKLSPAITLLHPQLYICLLAFSPWASPPFVSFLSSPIFPSFLIWTINVQSPQYLLSSLNFFFPPCFFADWINQLRHKLSNSHHSILLWSYVYLKPSSILALSWTLVHSPSKSCSPARSPLQGF